MTRTGSDTGTKTINAVTGSGLTDNTWGFKASGNAFTQVPVSSSPVVLYSSSTAETNKTIGVTYGVKVDNTLPSGTYSNDVVYTVVVDNRCLQYTLSFVDEDDTTKLYPDISVNYGDNVNLNNYTPTKSGYTFAGWTNGSSTYTGNTNPNPTNDMMVTLKAKWTDNCELSSNCRTVKDATYSGLAELVIKDGQKVLALSGPTNGTSYVSLPALSNVNIANGFTVEAKVAWTKYGAWSRILDINNGTSDNIVIGAYPPGDSIGVSVRNGADVVIQDTSFGNGSIELNVTNVWKIVLRRKTSSVYTVDVYKDNLLIGTKDYTTTVNNVSTYQNVWIGRSAWNYDGNFNGYIHYVKMTLADGTEVIDVDFNKA
ncbi:InlB B-repeat-containing protein [Candidatus Saccharibacteria bacterium]|nr:InlB B-repeat-containing protein [Candidatus Saccharibacteria bacterium]